MVVRFEVDMDPVTLATKRETVTEWREQQFGLAALACCLKDYMGLLKHLRVNLQTMTNKDLMYQIIRTILKFEITRIITGLFFNTKLHAGWYLSRSAGYSSTT